MALEDQKIDYVEFPAQNFDAVQAFCKQAFDWELTDPQGNEPGVWSAN
jgi:predicted enzyme related to lactoylglutathione lyase